VNSVEAINKRVKVNPLKSRFLVASAGFALLSASMAALAFGQTKPTDFAYNTWTTWAIKEFVEEAKKPDLVFLGSSLMLVPLDSTDADHLQRRIDGSAHHKSAYFEDRFAEKTGQKVSTYNFSLPGEMPSDAALITDFLLKGEKAPKVIVYGVGPRDFLDNLLQSPAATDPFQTLSRFGDWTKRVDLIVPQWQERLSYELGQAFYTYGSKSQLVFNANKVINALLDKVAPQPQLKQTAVELAGVRRLLLPDYHPFEINRQQCLFSPELANARPKFEDNVGEYRQRYKNLKLETFNGQMQFLSDILVTAKSRDIHVVLVAMPITDVNRNLLSDNIWKLYCDRLRTLAAANSESTTFFDMQASGGFKTEDFKDTLHLHSGGGAKLLDKIVQVMATDKPTMAALTSNNNIALERFRQTTRQEAMIEQKESPAL